jgi:hypothetical protein
MPDYNLTRLGTREFEHLAQALSLKLITPGMSIFGDGPDGAREATYQGPTHFPTAGDAWDGYVVLQAKFRTTLSEDRRADGLWY